MITKDDFPQIADQIKDDILSKSDRKKQMKVKTLLEMFGYEKRTEDNTGIITELLGDRNIILNPSIMKLGDAWQLTWNDRVFLNYRTQEIHEVENQKEVKFRISENWNSDGWFDKIITAQLRNEKEVENKFIIPLLYKLGFTDDDRYDGMTLSVFLGAKPVKLAVDFAIYNIGNELLNNQVLLVAEAKKEERLNKEVEIDNTQKQVKSYAIWLSCHYGLITDSKKIQVLDLFSSIGGMQCIFECSRDQLKEKFQELYSIISKDALTEYYLNKIMK